MCVTLQYVKCTYIHNIYTYVSLWISEVHERCFNGWETRSTIDATVVTPRPHYTTRAAFCDIEALFPRHLVAIIMYASLDMYCRLPHGEHLLGQLMWAGVR